MKELMRQAAWYGYRKSEQNLHDDERGAVYQSIINQSFKSFIKASMRVYMQRTINSQRANRSVYATLNMSADSRPKLMKRFTSRQSNRQCTM